MLCFLTLVHIRALIVGSGPKFLMLEVNIEERKTSSALRIIGIELRFRFHGRGLKCGCW